ncbi:hypothetical protein ACNY67_01345 [Pantoea sp. KXB45]|uniref:hypothetical protein n=1 Tax=unclassified Pantoea TaxID=2630326 RepID=UPI003AB11278
MQSRAAALNGRAILAISHSLFCGKCMSEIAGVNGSRYRQEKADFRAVNRFSGTLTGKYRLAGIYGKVLKRKEKKRSGKSIPAGCSYIQLLFSQKAK